MSDGTVELTDKVKAAMRQTETDLNKSGGVAQRVRSPWSTPGSVTPSPASLGIHGAPYTDRHQKK
jgi:hypothetical protein